MSSRSLFIISICLGAALMGGLFLLIINRDNATAPIQPVQEVANNEPEDSLLPGPLRRDTGSSGFLTVKGTISETNRHRRENGQRTLSENILLNRAAESKLRDMFTNHYFVHQAPDGRGPSDLAKAAGYQYIIIGENLALGTFANDAELVQAWMDSPGHRANILKNSYTEIGVAVGEGMYDGELAWIAVQEFGRPASDCPPVNRSREALLESNKRELDVIEDRIAAKQAEISKTPTNTPEYNQKAGEYNQLVEEYNALSARSKQLAEVYNADVDRYNSCIRAAVN